MSDCRATAPRYVRRIKRSCWLGLIPSAAGSQAGEQLVLHTRDPDLEELVEVVREDRQELRALQQRDIGALGQVEHASR
jgi:hypothetical protein